MGACMVDLLDLVDIASRLAENSQDEDFQKNFKLLVAQYQSWCGNDKDRPAPTSQYIDQVQHIIGVNPTEFSADKDIKILRSIFYLTGKKLSFQKIAETADAISIKHGGLGATAAWIASFYMAVAFAKQCLDKYHDFKPDHCVEANEISTFIPIATRYNNDPKIKCSEIQKILQNYQKNLLTSALHRPQIYNDKHTLAKLQKVNYLNDSFEGHASGQDKLKKFKDRLAEPDTIKKLTQTRDTATSGFFKGLATLCILPGMVLACLSKMKTGTYNYFKGSSGDKTVNDIIDITGHNSPPSAKGGG